MGKIFAITAALLALLIGLLAFMKKEAPPKEKAPTSIPLQVEPKEVAPLPIPPVKEDSEPLPTADLMDRLFVPSEEQLPYVITLSYKSRVPWLEGKPAWIADYATHYRTSRHFIGRSLSGKGNYTKDEAQIGRRFNVLNPDKEIEFYLLVDLSKAKMWVYLYDKGAHKRILLKDYIVGLGRPDPLKASGSLTPKGKYLLGNRIASYTKESKGNYKGEKIEMVRVFGTRWIPFEKEISGTTAPAKGYGIHGLPWENSPVTGELAESDEGLGTYLSDGCIRLAAADMEELYALIVTRPTTIEIVDHFSQRTPPGEES